MAVGSRPRPSATSTLRCRRSLADAHRFGLVPRNVAALVKPPSPGGPRRNLHCGRLPRCHAIPRVPSTDDRLMPGVPAVWPSTGMRRGEALGLRWSDVDLGKSAARREPFVDRRLTTALVWSSPKDVAVASELVARSRDGRGAARCNRSRQVEEKLVAGPDGSTKTSSSATSRRSRCIRTASPGRSAPRFDAPGVRSIRLHDLRHTWATLALQAGIHPKVVSERSDTRPLASRSTSTAMCNPSSTPSCNDGRAAVCRRTVSSLAAPSPCEPWPEVSGATT